MKKNIVREYLNLEQSSLNQNQNINIFTSYDSLRRTKIEGNIVK